MSPPVSTTSNNTFSVKNGLSVSNTIIVDANRNISNIVSVNANTLYSRSGVNVTAQAAGAYAKANAPITIREVYAGNSTVVNTFTNINTIQFDADSGMAVVDNSSNTVTIQLNSTFKYWTMNGSPGLTAVGLDTVNFVGANGIVVSANNNASPKSITFDFNGAGGTGPQGPSGVTGAQGPQGPSGASVTGAQGPQGVTGAQGPQGPSGASVTGAQGPQGPQGPSGASVTGAQGPQGPQGVTGAQGPQGVTGAQGPQGPSGASVTGAQGPQGPQGDTGAQGPQGVTGAQGPQGPSGASVTGAQGPQGPQGPQGVTGAQGPQGPSGASVIGAQGPQGATGSTGAQGPQGPSGPAGSGGGTSIVIKDEGTTITSNVASINFVGSGVTASNTGNDVTITITGGGGGGGSGNANVTVSSSAPSGARANQDFWWDSDTGMLKIYYDDGTSSQWVDSVTRVTGNTGNTGPQGPQGAQGPSGPSGAGAQGPQGPQGAAGSRGLMGGVNYVFSAFNTANSDPGVGNIRYNNTTISSVTQLYIDNINGDSSNVGTWINSWDASSASPSGYVVISSTDAGNEFTNIFGVTSVDAQSGYYTVNVTYLSGSIASAAANVSVNFSSAGSAGPQGPQGPQGPAAFNIKGTIATVGSLPGSPAASDAYILTSNNTLWTWTGSAWVNSGPIVGPSGPSGPTSEIGFQFLLAGM